MYRNKRYRVGKPANLPNTSKSAQAVVQTVQNEENIFEGVEDQILCSQPDNTKFMSQRNAMRTQSIMQLTATHNYFENILIKCECDFKSNISNVILSNDHISFTRSLRLHLKSSSIDQDNLNKFLESFKETFTLIGKDAEYCLKFLNGCLINPGHGKQRAPSQSSPIKCFLSIDYMQSAVAKILLDKLKEYVIKLKSDVNLNTVALLLQQFKFSNQIFDREMFDEIFAIFELTTNPECKELIIGSFLDIIPFYHDCAVKKLIEHYTNDHEFLTPSIISTLVLMDIKDDTIQEIHQKIKNYLKSGATIKVYPSMVKFLLLDTSKVELTNGIISILRKCLKWNSADFPETEVKRCKMLVFDCITKALRRSKVLFDCWYKAIVASQNLADQKSIDFLVLLIMINVREEKFTSINSLIKQKLRKGFYGTLFLEKIFNNFGCIINLNASRFLELLEVYFRDKNDEINSFAGSCFKFLFKVAEVDKKSVILKLIALICEKTAGDNLPFSIHSDYKTNSLNILKELERDENEKHTLVLMNNLNELLKILDYSVELNTHQFRLALDILCSLSYSVKINSYANQNHKESAASVREHLKMLVNKLIGSRITEYKKQGIIAGVKIISSQVLNYENISYTDDTTTECSFDISDVPDGPTRNAADLVQLLFSVMKDNTELLGLCYDEFSVEFSLKRSRVYTMHPQFMLWFEGVVRNHFEQNFVMDENIPAVKGVNLTFQYFLNEPSEQALVGIDIAGKVFTNDANKAILLPPLFKLLRILNYIHKRDLDRIDALLGCGLVLPDIFQKDDFNLYDDFDSQTAKRVMDSYFLTCNWFREIVSAFAFYLQKDDDGDEDKKVLREFVIQRFIQLIKIEHKIPDLLRSLQDKYIQPVTDFMNTESNKKILEGLVKTKRAEKPAKKPAAKRSKKNANEEPNTENVDAHEATMHPDTQAQVHSMNKIKALEVDELPRELFRSMDPDIVWFFHVNFDFSDQTYNTFDRKLGLTELRFIFEDMIHKSEIVFRPSIKKMSSESASEPDKFLECMGLSFRKMIRHTWTVKDLLKEKIRQSMNDGTEDCLYTDYTNSLKSCLNTFLKLISIVFSWKNITLEKHRSLLRKILNCFIEKSVNTTDKTFSDFCDLVIKIFRTFEPMILDIKSGVYLIDIIESISKFKLLSDEVPDLSGDQKILQEMAGRFLERRWYNSKGLFEASSNINPCMDIFLKHYVSKIDLKTLEEYVAELTLEATELKKKGDYMKQFPSVNRLNILHLFRAYISQLNYLVQEKGDELTLSQWEASVDILTKLLDVSKSIGINNIYSAFMKFSQAFIKLFIQYGLPMVEKNILRNTDRILNMITNLKKSTQFLHTLVCQSKKIKNTVIAAQIPSTRQILQTLLYKVQGIFAANNCKALKVFVSMPKDLQDELIVTQNSLTQEPEDDVENIQSGDEVDDDTGNDIESLVNDGDPNSSSTSNSSRSTVL